MARRSTKYKYDAVYFSAFIQAVREDLNIQDEYINFKFRPMKHYSGLHTYYNDGSHLIEIRPTENLVEICKTVMHELRHVYQYAHGRLYTSGTNARVWRGKEYTEVSSKMDYKAYRALPWEIDAVRYSRKYKKFLYLVQTA